MNFRKLFIAILFFFLLLIGKSQDFNNYLKEVITSKDGLPSNEVYQIIQDKNKRLWFTTDNGVVRYNGREFKVFNSNDGLPNNTVFNLYEQPDGKIYGEGNYGDFFYIDNDSIVPYPYNHIIDKYIYDAVQCYSFYKDSLSNIHIGSRNGYIVINKKGEVIKKDLGTAWHETSNSLNLINFSNYILSYSTNSLENNNTIYEISKNNKQLISSQKIKNAEPTQANYSRIIDDSTYAVIYLENVHIIKNHEILQNIKFRNIPISVSVTDSLLWVGTANDGVYSYKRNGTQFELVNHFLDGHSVTSVLKDHENGFWFSTREQGVTHIYDFNVTKIFQSKNNQNISTFYSDKEYTFIGFENGELINLNNEKSILNKNSKYPIDYISNLNNKYLFFSGGLLFEIKNNTLKNLKIIDRKKSEVAYGLVHINDTLVAFYGISDVFIYNTKKEQILIHINKKKIKGRITRVIKFNHSLVIGTNKNVFFINLTDYSITNSIAISSPVSSLATHKNNLYIACRNGNILIGNDHLLKKLNIQSSINTIYSTAIVNDNLIIATNLGVYKYLYDNINNKWTIYDFLNLKEVNKIYILEKKIYYATKKEIYLDYNLKRKNTVPILGKIDVTVNGRSTLPNQLLSLRYNENDISIMLNGISYSYPLLKFKYQLTGVDKTYKYASESIIHYPALAPGIYLFKVSVTANDVDFSNEKLLTITITPPFWQTNWFIGIVLISFLIILIVFYFKQIKKIRTKHALNETILQLRSKALVTQLNPHLVFNVLNSIQGIISEGELEKANKYLAQFSKFMRKSLELSKNSSVGLQEEIDITNHYISLEMIRHPKNLSITLNNELNNPNKYQLPPLIIQPFIENAIKHGTMPSKNIKGIINIAIQEKDNVLCICIEDNGIGFKVPLNINSGDGIRISKERLQILNRKNDVYINSTNEKTVVTLKIYP